MQDTDPRFDEQVRLLSEAGRIDHKFAERVWAATSDDQIDDLVEDARKLIEDAAQEAY